MTDLAAGTVAAKVDVYPDNPGTRQGRTADRMTFVLDRVTAVQLASSKTHPFAFELVETEPVLVLSGLSETESFSWMSALRHIFFAELDNTGDIASYTVSIHPNTDSQRLGLSGHYMLRVSPDSLTLLTCPPQLPVHSKTSSLPKSSPSGLTDSEGTEQGPMEEGEGLDVMAWKLSMLKRFNVDRNSSGQPRIFVLNCGPNSPSGEATLYFISSEANNILASIRRCINVAIATREHIRQTSTDSRNRTESVLTITGYQALLHSSPSALDVSATDAGAGTVAENTKVRSERSRSGSSTSTMTPVSPTSSTGDVGLQSEILGSDCQDDGLPIRQKQRLSVSSSSSSPKTSDAFGSELQHQQEVSIQQWQQQQIMLWQQQQRNSPLLWAQQQLPAFHQPWAQQVLRLPDPHQQLQHWTQQQQLQVRQQQQQQQVQTLAKDRMGLMRNCSVPSDMAMAFGDSGHITASKEDADLVRLRTNSMTIERPRASESVCSGDSGVVVTDRTSTHRGSNSFDSNISTESTMSIRKTNDLVEPILESPSPVACSSPDPTPLDDKTTPSGSNSHIYQDLDAVGADRARGYRRLSSVGQGRLERRRHSTGDVRKENDYEEVEGLRKGVAPAASIMTVTDTPPELPARPSFFTNGKTKSLNKGRLSSAFSFLTGGQHLASLRGRRGKELSCEEIPTSHRDRDGVLSRSGSSDLYSTINDVDFSKVSRRRRSSDITPVSSHPDLRIPDRPSTPKYNLSLMPVPHTCTSRNDTLIDTAGQESQSEKDSTAGSKNLLTFSESDISLVGETEPNRSDSNGGGSSSGGLGPDCVIQSKAALMDFFLNDATFHANPMVTGALMLSGTADTDPESGSFQRAPQTQNVAAVTSRSPSQSWADLSNLSHFSHFEASGNPRREIMPITGATGPVLIPITCSSSSFTPATHADSGSTEKGTGITASVEGVYIDMRKPNEEKEDAAGCDDDYVAPGDLSKHQAFLDFFVFQ